MIKQLLAVLAFAFPVISHASEVVQTCKLGTGPGLRVSVTRQAKAADSYIYAWRGPGGSHLFFESREASRGSAVRIICAGNDTHALVVFGEFTANALQGFVLRENPSTHRLDRLDFAEKVPPAWLFLGTSKTQLAFETGGYGETDKKYVIYSKAIGSDGDADSYGEDILPAAEGTQAIRLN